MKKLTEEQWKDFKEAITKLASFSLSKKQEISAKTNKTNNIFQILRVEDFEIRHTNFLDWLFNNNQSFLQEFLQQVCGIPAQQANAMSASKLFETHNPYKITKGRLIDLVLDFDKDKYLIVIENKVYSGEGVNQLREYHKFIEEEQTYKGYNTKKFIYLTLNGIEPEDEDDRNNWQTLSYDTILKILVKIKLKPKSSDDIMNILIDHYCQTLQIKIKENEKEMDYFKEFYKTYYNNKNFKDTITEIVKFVPDIDARSAIERDYVNTHDNFQVMTGDKAHIYIHFYDKQISNLTNKNNLPEDWIWFEITNNDFTKLTVVIYITKDKDKKYANFATKYGKKFNRNYNRASEEADIMSLESFTLISSNSQEGYITEQEFQSQIEKKLNDFFESKEYLDRYNFIVDYLKN